MFLATLNKSIKYSNFRNTKQIFVFVYLLALSWAVGGSLLLIAYLHQFSRDNEYLLHVALLAVTVVLSLTILQLSAYAQVSDTSMLTGNMDPLVQIRPGSLRQSSTRIKVVS